MKTCTKCQTLKNFSEFHKYYKSADGYKPHCKSCVREYDLSEHDAKRVFDRKVQGIKMQCRWCKEYLESNSFGKNTTYCKECSLKVGHRNNIRRFNLTPEQYIDLSNAQNNVCKICNNSENKRLSIDHDHSCCNGQFSCGKCIRGLICSRCNRTLGMVNDDKELLQKMIRYL
jgi:hypothetical protein